MKNLYLNIALSMLIVTSHCFAQNSLFTEEHIKIDNKIISKTGHAPSVTFLSRFEPKTGSCITREQSAYITASVRKNIEMLKSQNPGKYNKSSMVHPLFIWPTQSKVGFTDYGYYSVFNLVDNNLSNPNQLLDYNCGARTYDWFGGNHQGTDIVLWPYPWLRMDEQVMEVVAAAPGIIVEKVDGNFDKSCVNAGNPNWNYINILHDDGSVSWYLHFKSGSLTTKGIGDSVVAGEYLATAGSSGSSTIPHLHFQVMDENDNVIDPYQGTCNIFNNDTWWESQQDYISPAINRIATLYSMQYYYNCPDPEITYEKDTFNLGDSLVLRLFYKDLDYGAVTTVNFYNPLGEKVITWDFVSPWSFTPATYGTWYYILESSWVPGAWTFEAIFAGNTYQHQFYINSSTSVNDIESLHTIQISPNPSSGEFKIEYYSPTVGDALMEIVNVMGQTVAVSTISLSEGLNKIDIDENNFSAGSYLLKISAAGNTFQKKIVINN